MTAAHPTTAEDRQNRPWIVQFDDFRYRDDRQRDAIEGLDRGVLNEVLKIWLKVITPGACFDLNGASPNLIFFRARSHARHFVATFGGRLLGR
jgi:hypothetical protein